MSQTKTITFSELILLSGNAVHDAQFEVRYTMVNNGIGPYEFWGANLTDIDMQPEIDEIIYLGNEHSEEINGMLKTNFDDMCELVLEKLYW